MIDYTIDALIKIGNHKKVKEMCEPKSWSRWN